MLEYGKLVRVVGLYKGCFYAQNGYMDFKAKLFYPHPLELTRFIPVVDCERKNKDGKKLVIENVRATND